MAVFLKSLGNKAWKVVIKGWKHPMITSEDGTTNQKLEADWTDVEDDEALGNSKALSENFNGVNKNIFRLINIYPEAKEAYEILKTAHEGISEVCMSRLQLLTTKFENVRMNGDETVSEFYIRLRDISRKIIRSLPKRFDIKVILLKNFKP